MTGATKPSFGCPTQIRSANRLPQCLTRFKAHEMVIEYTGMIVRTQVADLREAQYARRGLGCYMFALHDGRIIDATQRGNVARYINHSCGGGDGNVETNTRTGRMEAKGKGPNCMAKYFTVVRPFDSLPSYPTSRGSQRCVLAGRAAEDHHVDAARD